MSRLAPSLSIALIASAFLPQPGVQAGERGSRYAFLVGCAQYRKTEFRTLPYAGNDVLGFRDALVATGFKADHVVVLHDKAEDRRFLPLREQIFAELDLLIDGMRPDDTLVVALSGHGLQFKGEGISYLVPVDGKVTDKRTLIPLNGPGGLYERIKACKAGKKLLIVNTCRNDPTVNLDYASQKAELENEDRDEVPKGIAAIYSCAAGHKSYYDPDRKRALFFEHLIAAWRGEYLSGGKVTLEHVFEQAVARTKMDAYKIGVKQVPQIQREYQGEWVVAAAPVPRLSAPIRIAGSWTGTWENSLGETGTETLVLKEDSEGNLSGVWWDVLRIKGKRLDSHRFVFEGATETRAYQSVARFQGNQLIITYTATRLDEGGTYTGKSVLQRVD
jgi:hypothetical protein